MAAGRVANRRQHHVGVYRIRPDAEPHLLRNIQPRAMESRGAPGSNKWTSGVFARDADTGQAVWFYQMSRHNLFDWDGINEDTLLDLPWNGQTRKVLVRPDRNGYIYIIDRASGQVLSATSYVYTATRRAWT